MKGTRPFGDSFELQPLPTNETLFTVGLHAQHLVGGGVLAILVL